VLEAVVHVGEVVGQAPVAVPPVAGALVTGLFAVTVSLVLTEDVVTATAPQVLVALAPVSSLMPPVVLKLPEGAWLAVFEAVDAAARMLACGRMLEPPVNATLCDGAPTREGVTCAWLSAPAAGAFGLRELAGALFVRSAAARTWWRAW
jgi:hypothetical protein